ncbi:ABC transporter ATP-binding protein [Actinomadura sp. LOL_016]|uniref:ABC transporter ATP-binding protein n=1 Tax=unclassified Actinomadura TaxID=2626254 RepID=UPI003A7FCA90
MRLSSSAVAPAAQDQPIPGVEVDALSKFFVDDHGTRVSAVSEVSLSVAAGEFLVLLGPSGCGKTTLLRCLAGLETPDRGTIRLNGQVVFNGERGQISGIDRRIGFVFQNYALWPHMTVEQNVAYPLTTGARRERADKAEARRRVTNVLELMGLADHAKRNPGQLSGGQQQRVALARAIVAGNDVVLFDEPLSNIDAKVRENLRKELRSLQREMGFTAVYVTHDQAEALELADRIAVMREGEIVQMGPGEEIYERPRTRYVADFVGTSNLLPLSRPASTTREGAVTVDTTLGQIVVGTVATADGSAVASRAHAWWISADLPAAGSANCWRGVVTSRAYLGWHDEFVVDVNGVPVRIWAEHGGSTAGLGAGDEVNVGVSPEDCVVVGDDD